LDDIEDEGEIVHVHFYGMDRDFERVYGASVPIEMAKDRNRDVLLAWEMNGVAIPPDHGFPLRVIVPGKEGERECVCVCVSVRVCESV